MSDAAWWSVLLAALFTDNILLVRFLGLCPFLRCSARLDTAWGLGLAVTFVTACTTVLNHLLYHHLLVPLELAHLRVLLFIAVIAAFVQVVEMAFERFSPVLHQALGLFLPLITVNCAVLGASLFMVLKDLSLLQATAYGLGAGGGWTLAILLMAGLRDRIDDAAVPRAFRGTPIVLIATGLLAMAFRGFAGWVS